jgi:hypothetical protein
MIAHFWLAMGAAQDPPELPSTQRHVAKLHFNTKMVRYFALLHRSNDVC